MNEILLWVFAALLRFPQILRGGIDFEYIGCYSDNTIRALRYGPNNINKYDIKSCFIACQNYKYFALQNGTQCFCENDFKQCIMYGQSTNCRDNRGANWTNSLYHIIPSTLTPYKHYGRKLQQVVVIPSKNISCSFISNNTCHINVNQTSFFGILQVVCDPDYPKCVINCTENGCSNSNSIPHLHCPSDMCSSCIVNNTGSLTRYASIRGYNCELLQIDSTEGTVLDSWIFAPGHGGSLIINNGRFISDNIYSSIGTANMIFNFPLFFDIVSETFIDGTYVTGHLNFSSYSFTYNTNINCGMQAVCNINCLAEKPDMVLIGCINLTVHTWNTSVVSWQCNSESQVSCENSKVSCGDSHNLSYSKLEWKAQAKIWYFSSSECGISLTGLPRTCQFTTFDSCIIYRTTYPVYPQDLICDSQYENCQIQVAGTPTQIDDSFLPIALSIQCPSQTCVSCVIYCDDEHSCTDVKIFGFNCKLLQISIRGGYHTNMEIYAPANDGELIINYIDQTNGRGWQDTVDEYYGISNSGIHSVPGTKNMLFNFAECPKCDGNIMNGTYVTNDMNVLCNGYAGTCRGSVVICPNDANCFIDCSATYYFFLTCGGMKVIAPEGTNDVNWICDGLHKNCMWRTLECERGISNWITNATCWPCPAVWYWDNLICINPPSEAPTATPTAFSLSPSVPPTETPTTSPTSAPTTAPLNFHEKIGLSTASYYGILIGSFIGSLLCFGGLICCTYYIIYYKYKPRKERKAKIKYITNALVLLIAIGDYNESETEDTEPEIDGYLADLDGVENDVKNMQELFYYKLNYDVFPAISRYPKCDWTEKELKDFLEDRANYLENNITQGKEYDGLVLIISCHGIPYYLCTSDYKTYSKVAVHRTFSLGHPKSREIPRFILYDCCSGDNLKESVSDSESDLEEKSISVGKNVEELNITTPKQAPWIVGEQNPDYMLGRVEAANQGFQSRLDSRFGSHVIYKFYQKSMENIDNNQGKFIHEIFDEIQDELHRNGKQHPEFIWNNDTRYMVFRKNDQQNTNTDQIKIKEKDSNLQLETNTLISM